MKIVLIFFLILLLYSNIHSREIGETEITTEEGIEVFQSEKFYLLKKNVEIVSDNFLLKGNLIKIHFNESLYDITTIEADENVELNSIEYKIDSKGDKLLFNVVNQEIQVEGMSSELNLEDVKMISDGFIYVNNNTGEFRIEGPKSELINKDFQIKAVSINGIYSETNGQKEIVLLNIFDNELSFFKSNDIQMYAEKIDFDNKKSLIELNKNVKIIRGGEVITGDYGTLDTVSETYKIKSKESKKVKVIITNKDE